MSGCHADEARYSFTADIERGQREGVKAPPPRGAHRGHSQAEAHAFTIAAAKGRHPAFTDDDIDAMLRQMGALPESVRRQLLETRRELLGGES